MKQVLYHEENNDLNRAIKEQHHLSETQGEVMMEIIRKVILQVITPNALAETIQREVGLNTDQSQALALDLLSKRFLPMEWYLGPIQPLIHELGGNVTEALAEAQQRYPEVYNPQQQEESYDLTGEEEPSAMTAAMLENFEDRIGTMRGKADILLRLTGLSTEVETMMQSGALDQETGNRMMRDLEAVSYAVNTQDLNPFEVNSIKRKIKKVLAQLPPA